MVYQQLIYIFLTKKPVNFFNKTLFCIFITLVDPKYYYF